MSSAKLPGEHAVGCVLPPTQKCPSGQSKHSGSPEGSDALAYVPGSHVGGSSSELPRGQKLPCAHGLHDDAPNSSWYVDAGHSVHVALRARGAWLPGLHADGAVEPVAHAWPSSHVVHCAADERLVALE